MDDTAVRLMAFAKTLSDLKDRQKITEDTIASIYKKLSQLQMEEAVLRRLLRDENSTQFKHRDVSTTDFFKELDLDF